MIDFNVQTFLGVTRGEICLCLPIYLLYMVYITSRQELRPWQCDRALPVTELFVLYCHTIKILALEEVET